LYSKTFFTFRNTFVICGATGYALGDQGIVVRFPVEERGLYLFQSVRTGSGVLPPSYLLGTDGEVTKTWNWSVVPFSAENKNVWSSTSTSRVRSWCAQG